MAEIDLKSVVFSDISDTDNKILLFGESDADNFILAFGKDHQEARENKDKRIILSAYDMKRLARILHAYEEGLDW